MNLIYPQVKVFKREAAHAFFEKIIESIKTIINQSDVDTKHILHSHGFNLAKFFDFLQNSSMTQLLQVAKYTKDDSICCICFEEREVFVCQKCNCSSCHTCLETYLNKNLSKHEPLCKCFGFKCNFDINSKLTHSFGHDFFFENFLQSEFIKKCKSPKCQNYVYNTNQITDFSEVRCFDCDFGWCFSCQDYSHEPISCTLYQEWISKFSGNLVSKKWIINHTNKCPSCNTAIQKNGGCNHIHCTECKTHFCWKCGVIYDQSEIYKHNSIGCKETVKSQKISCVEDYIQMEFVKKYKELKRCQTLLESEEIYLKRRALKCYFFALKVIMYGGIMKFYLERNEMHNIDKNYVKNIDTQDKEKFVFYYEYLYEKVEIFGQIFESKDERKIIENATLFIRFIEIIFEIIKEGFMMYPQKLAIPEFKKIEFLNTKYEIRELNEPPDDVYTQSLTTYNDEQLKRFIKISINKYQ